MSKTVQIPYDLFMALVRYHWMHDRDTATIKCIKDGLSEKVDAMAAREHYAAALINKKNGGVTPP